MERTKDTQRRGNEICTSHREAQRKSVHRETLRKSMCACACMCVRVQIYIYIEM